jgi:hypothetical protein
MSPKNFLILSGATALSVILAVGAVTSRDMPLTARPGGEALLPGLLDRANEVRTVKITGPGATKLTVEAAEAGWRVVEKGGYPARPAEIRELVLQLAGLQVVEPKTAQAERLKRLELEDPGAEAAKSRLVELLDSEGKPIAAAVVGKTSYGLYGGGRSGVYVRRAGEPQSWLAAGSLELPTDALDLVDMQIIDLPVAEVARVTLGVGGEELALHRSDPATQTFTVDATPPEGRAIDPAKVEEVAGMLAALSMQDVKPAKDLAPSPEVRRSRVETFDGLVVDVTVTKSGEGDGAETWVQLQASAKPPAAPPPAATDGAATAPPTAEKRAADLNAKAQGWAYKVPTYLGDRLGASINDLLQDPQPAS